MSTFYPLPRTGEEVTINEVLHISHNTRKRTLVLYREVSRLPVLNIECKSNVELERRTEEVEVAPPNVVPCHTVGNAGEESIEVLDEGRAPLKP